MTSPLRPRLLIVDDEEAILETMTFTFEDEYEVLTSRSAERGLELLDAHAPVAVVVSDQRMPEMTGVEFLARVFERHPTAVRIILTGFADMDATIGAINDGHVYAYVTKPWEPDELKQVVRRAAEHHRLAEENERLLKELRDANVFLEAVMDELDTGAVALDASGVVRAVNRPVLEFLNLEGDPKGRELKEVLSSQGLEPVAGAAIRVASDPETRYEELELPRDGAGLRLRVHVHPLVDPEGRELGSVILLREISHEPLRRRVEEILGRVVDSENETRDRFAEARRELSGVVEEVTGSPVQTLSLAQLGDSASRALTAMEHWLAVDDALVEDDFPDAQLLLERMRIATSRWPLPDQLPRRVEALARRLEAYYESGENPKQSAL